MESKELTFENLPVLVGELFDLVERINSKLPESNGTSNIDLMSINEVAELFKVSLPTVHSYVKKGILVKYKMGANTYFKREEVLSTLFNSKSVA
tara:strand:- start:253 stop:534 length:282 start_codon:yes stop_codon:yes gene_type:complete